MCLCCSVRGNEAALLCFAFYLFAVLLLSCAVHVTTGLDAALVESEPTQPRASANLIIMTALLHPECGNKSSCDFSVVLLGFDGTSLYYCEIKKPFTCLFI